MSTQNPQEIGLSPGTVKAAAGDIEDKFTITLTHYDEKSLEEKHDTTIDECLELLNEPGVSWIQITGAHNPAMIEKIGKLFELHPLLLEDIASSGERPKIESYTDNFFFILRLLELNENTQRVRDRQVSLIFGKNYVISFFEKETSLLNPIRERIRRETSRIRKMGSDYLTYAIIDAIVDHYFIILEQVDDKLEQLEEELIHSPTPKTLRKIQRSKKEMILIRRSVWPMREVISHFRRLESPLIHPDTQLFLHDVYDHTIQAIDTIEGFRDLVGGLLEIYLSTISQKLNEIMKILTILATIFAPLTFLTGVYGMNFEWMPGLHSENGFFIVMAVMLLAATGMIYFFHKKKWI